MRQLRFSCAGNTRLDRILRDNLPEKLEIGNDSKISNGKIRRLIISGSIKVDGRQCRIPSFNLKKGSVIDAYIDEEKFFYEKEPDDIDFVLTDKDVLFEDDVLIVVRKPAFLPTEGTVVENRKSMHSCVIDYLWKKNPGLRNPPYAGIMHRLDRTTSGIILFTKSRSVNKKISEMFKDHKLTKTYEAVCTARGTMPKEGSFFTVEGFMGRASGKSKACKMDFIPESMGGQFSKTEFKITSVKDGKIRVDCNLLTGRTHQIRLHLSSRKLPILGDELYGGNRHTRIMLHAKVLEFAHPVTGEKIRIECNPDF